MESVKEVLGSVWFLLFAVSVPFCLIVLNKLLRREKCPSCNIGTVKEQKVENLESVHFDASAGDTGGGYATSKVRAKVTYRCTHCGETNETTETR